MIEIALCDDNAEDIALLKAYTERFAAEHSEFPMQLRSFLSSEELLEHLENSGGFDLYILDVVMPKMSGIQLAEIIRSRGEHAEIVFLTVSQDYALDAFSVYASGYLLKPPRREKFDETILRAVLKLTQSKSELLTVKTKDGMRRIPLYKIVMIESFNHTREIVMSDDSVLETSVTLSELFEQLKEHKNFFMPHRAYIANLDNSVGITRYDLHMLGDRRIPIPKNQFVTVREFAQNYFFNKKRM